MLVAAAILALAAVVGLLYLRFGPKPQVIVEFAELPESIQPAAAAFGYRLKTNSHPVDSLEDSEVAIAAIGIAFLELGGLPRPGQHEALQKCLQIAFSQSPQRCQQSLVLGNWLIAQCGGPVVALDRLTARLRVLSADAGLLALIGVLQQVSEWGGNLTSGRQQDALAAISSQLKAA